MNPSTYRLSSGSSLALDMLRFVSAQLVVIGHGIAFFGLATFLHEPNFPWMQNAAVLLFFLLSGFLIPYSVMRRSSQDDRYSMSTYLIDRFSRIYVPFVVALLFVLALDSLSRHLSPDRYKYSSAFNVETFVGNVFMLQDHVAWRWFDDTTITSFGSARPFWTLAIEWWIYLFFGFVALVLFRRSTALVPKIAAGILLGLVPVYHAVGGRGNALTTYWILGGIVFILVAGRASGGLPRVVRATLIVAALALGVWRAYLEMDAYDPVFAIFLALALWLGIEWFEDVDFGAFASRLARGGASYAYTLYLVHYSIIDFIQIQGTDGRQVDPRLLFAISLVSSNVVAYSIAVWVEGPLTRQVKSALHGWVPNR